MRNCIQNVPRVPAQFLNDCGEDPMPRRESIVILDGARRKLRADIRENNRAPGLFSRFSMTQLGGMAIGATLEHTGFDRSLVGHVVMGTAAHSHRDLICGAQGMRCRGGLGRDVPALTVAGICGRHP